MPTDLGGEVVDATRKSDGELQLWFVLWRLATWSPSIWRSSLAPRMTLPNPAPQHWLHWGKPLHQETHSGATLRISLPGCEPFSSSPRSHSRPSLRIISSARLLLATLAWRPSVAGVACANSWPNHHVALDTGAASKRHRWDDSLRQPTRRQERRERDDSRRHQDTASSVVRVRSGEDLVVEGAVALLECGEAEYQEQGGRHVLDLRESSTSGVNVALAAICVAGTTKVPKISTELKCQYPAHLATSRGTVPRAHTVRISSWVAVVQAIPFGGFSCNTVPTKCWGF